LKKRILFIVLLLTGLFADRLNAQYYSIGQAPSSWKWMQASEGNFTIIYPDFSERKALKTLRYFNREAAVTAKGLGVHPKRTPLLIHPQSAVSNAYAAWAPRRIELLSTAPQDGYAQPWLHQLALHEYRHIVQLTALDRGITRVAGLLFGQQAVAVSAGLFIPTWMLEGDAVVAETALSKSGRGREPFFSAPLRAQLAEYGPYNYSKASFGSYRDFIPDVYTTGYHIIAASRLKYGRDIWSHAFETAGRRPYLIAPVNRALKEKTGMNKRKLYTFSVGVLDSLWEETRINQASHLYAEGTEKSYTSYYSPRLLTGGRVVAVKTSLHDIPRLVCISKEGKQRVIHTPGYIFDNYIAQSGDLLAWVEYRPHPRWQTVSYTDLVTFNMETGKASRRALKSRVYSPAFSPAGDALAVVEEGYDGNRALLVFGGDSMERVAIPYGMFPSYPAWSEDGHSLIFVATSERGKALLSVNIENKSTDTLLPWSFREIREPFMAGGDVWFTASADGKSQICRLLAGHDVPEVITASAYGASRASASGDTLIYQDYTAGGNRLAWKRISQVAPETCRLQEPERWPLAEMLSQQERQGRITDPDTVVMIKPFRKGSNLFNIHSWGPVYIDVSTEQIRPGISVMSQNLLSTLFVTSGYEYNPEEREGMFRSEIAWKGWYPEIYAAFSGGRRASEYGVAGAESQRISWMETNVDLGISQTLNLSKGQMISAFIGGISLNRTSTRFLKEVPENLTDGSFAGFSYRLQAYTLQRQALRDLAPRKGYSIDLRFRHAVHGDMDAGNIFAAQAQLFAPGLFMNHSLSLYGAYQHTSPEKYRYSNIVAMPRGYSFLPSGDNATAFRVNYRFPVAYPDAAVGGIAYLKRLRSNIFYDFVSVSGGKSPGDYTSVGLDLIADYHAFGLGFPLSTGLRGIYLPEKNASVFELIFSVDFYP